MPRASARVDRRCNQAVGDASLAAEEVAPGRGGGLVKFDMGKTTLTTLAQQTSGSSDDLGVLIRQLLAAAEPLEGKFNGSGKAAFDPFKAHADEITGELNGAAGDPGRPVRHGQGVRHRRRGDGRQRAPHHVDGELRRRPLQRAVTSRRARRNPMTERSRGRGIG